MVQHARWEEDTVPQRRLLEDTLELTPVEPPVAAPPQVDLPRVAGGPTSAPPMAPPLAPSHRRGIGTRWLALLAAAVLGLGTAGVTLALRNRPASTAAAQGALAVKSVRSVDPSGGSGFERAGDATWRTQHYRTARFGNLKPGVGLLVDLGEPRRVSSVTTRVAVPGISLELRAGDRANGAPGAFEEVSRQRGASGTTTLAASDAGSHRYWLLWVPRLGPDGSGYAAELRGLTVRG